jgi:hypothetical protein
MQPKASSSKEVGANNKVVSLSTGVKASSKETEAGGSKGAEDSSRNPSTTRVNNQATKQVDRDMRVVEVVVTEVACTEEDATVGATADEGRKTTRLC